jgi:hypothetical protein
MPSFSIGGVWRLFHFSLRFRTGRHESPNRSTLSWSKLERTMKRAMIAGLALASVIHNAELRAAAYATSVVDYQAGVLSGAVSGYTTPGSALGAPATFNPAYPPFTPNPTPITPFDGPYTSDQLVAVGEGGSLTVHFAEPIRNQAANPYGLDFIIYGGMALTDLDYPNGLSDGTVFGNLGGVTRISVSQDGATFYPLNPSLAPLTEAGLPTDSAGAFGVPANPALTPAAFAGKTLAEIRTMYAGSAGGASYDIGWAQDGLGQSVSLAEVNYVRVDVLTGQTKIDGLAAVPEPATWAIGLAGLIGLTVWRKRQAGQP